MDAVQDAALPPHEELLRERRRRIPPHAVLRLRVEAGVECDPIAGETWQALPGPVLEKCLERHLEVCPVSLQHERRLQDSNLHAQTVP